MGSIFKLTALAGVAAGAYAAVKKFAPNILPDKNEAEDMAKNAINSVKLTFPTDEKYSNGTALTPPMGWSSWNTFRNRIDEKLILETAEAMKASGLADAGYQYVNLDDCWQSSMRDENGRLPERHTRACEEHKRARTQARYIFLQRIAYLRGSAREPRQ